MDLKKPSLMYLKAMLFLLIGGISLFLMYMLSQDWRVLALACLAIWAFSRFYYFCFYVIEKYIDPKYKFSGLYSFVKYLLQKGKE